MLTYFAEITSVSDPFYKRCKCRESDGRELGARCPKLRRADGSWNPRAVVLVSWLGAVPRETSNQLAKMGSIESNVDSIARDVGGRLTSLVSVVRCNA
jgi:hypothetical protein